MMSEPGFKGFKNYQDFSLRIQNREESCKSFNPENHGSDKILQIIPISSK